MFLLTACPSVLDRIFTILHTEASTGWGGQEIRVFTEMEAMRQRGHRLYLAAPPISQIFQEADKAGFNPWELNSKRILFPFTIIKAGSGSAPPQGAGGQSPQLRRRLDRFG